MLTPPEVLRQREQLFQLAHGLEELDGVVVVLLDAGADGEDVGVEDDVSAVEAGLLGQQLDRRARRSRPCGRAVTAWPCSSKAMTTTAAP